MTETNKSIFICEDDADSRELLRFAFELEGCTVTTCDNLEECLAQARTGNFQAIILDNRLDGTSSVEVCRQLRDVHSGIPIIFYSGEARQAEIDKALAAGANVYLIKPLDFERLPETVIALIEKAVQQQF